MAEPLEPFLDVSDFNTFTGLNLNLTNPAAEFALEVGCQAIRTFLNRPINQIDEEIVLLDGLGSDVLVLPSFPVVEVTSVIEDGEALTEDEDFIVDLEKGMLFRLDTNWWRGRRSVEVEYSHGWSDDEIPADIRMVALRVARRAFNDVGEETDTTGTIKSETIGRFKYTLTSTNTAATIAISNLETGEIRALDPYRNRRMRAN